MIKSLIILMLVGVLAGCSKWQRNLEADKAKMQQTGWTYLETLGVSGPWVADGWLDSPTARSVGVGWVVNAKQEQKKYPQDVFLYSAHIYTKANGDSFVVVFQKEKPATPAAP